jgi:hypothetical protein
MHARVARTGMTVRTGAATALNVETLLVSTVLSIGF